MKNKTVKEKKIKKAPESIDIKITCTNTDCKLRKKSCKGFEGCPGFKM